MFGVVAFAFQDVDTFVLNLPTGAAHRDGIGDIPFTILFFRPILRGNHLRKTNHSTGLAPATAQVLECHAGQAHDYKIGQLERLPENKRV